MIRAGDCVSEIGGSLGSMGGCAIQAVVESHIRVSWFFAVDFELLSIVLVKCICTFLGKKNIYI